MTDGELALWRAWEERRDGDSFERLVRPHLRFLSDFARRAGCGAEADDAVQTALVELARARGDRPVRMPLRAWLGRSVLQQARMRARARRRRARHEAAAARPERVETRPSAHDEVERALARLDPDARLAVELRYLHDLDYKEIAHILKASEVACRIRVHRAIARLRRELGVLAPAMIAALPLLGGATDARAALARNATATAGTWLGGGLLMATKLKIAAGALLALTAILLWAHVRGERQPPARAEANARGAPPSSDPAPHVVTAAPAAGEEGAPGAAADDAEPPLTPGHGCVRGAVRFEDGTPLVGVRVSLWGESKVYDTTDERGRFHLHDDWVAGRPVYLAGPRGVRGPDAFGFILAEDVKMIPGETVRVEIVVKRGLRVAARVVAATSGEPVAGAKVELRRWDGDQLVAGQASYGYARTDARGRFAFEHAVPSDYSLAIVADGFEAQYAHWDLRQRTPPEVFRLDPARRLEIRLENAPPSAIGTTVRWSLERSIERGMKDGKPTFRQELFGIDGEAVLDEAGVLVGDAPPPGRWDLTIWPTKTLPRLERKEIDIGDGAVEAVTLGMESGARVEGRVTWPDGSPVSGADVLAGGLRATTDDQGRYAFDWLPGAVGGARKEFRIRLGGVVVPMGERTFEPREPMVVDFAMPGSGTVRFELGGAEANKFGAVEIRRVGEGEAILDRRIDPPITEPIVLRAVPAGRVQLYIWQWGRSWILREIHVEEGGELDLGALELPAWPRPEIRVRVAAGSELPAWVYVGPANDPGVPHSRHERVPLDGEGRGVLPSQPPGSRRILVQGAGAGTKEVEFTVDPDRPQVLDILLE